MNRLMLAGTNSGCGKTTVTCALLSALKLRKLDVTSFKCGPDYIDPMFHRETGGIKARNLDPFFCDRAELRMLLSENAGGDISIIEGAMGYYDGVACTDEASAYSVADATDTPVVLIVDAKGVGNSAGAVIEGFRLHRSDSKIAGVIFNRLGESRYADMARVAENAGVKAFGFLPYGVEMSVGSRHLGLITAGEISDIRERLARLGKIALETLDIDGLLALSRSAPPLEPSEFEVPQIGGRVRIAVANDEAFCFLYHENLDLMEKFGAELVYFSPLHDGRLPQNIGALYLCGGYPELHKEALSKQAEMLVDIRAAVQDGMPVIAECGGFMILHDALDGLPMAGAINGRAFRTEKLQRFGYITLTAKTDNLICKAGESIPAHEFHYWDSDNPGDGFSARKAGRDTEYSCVHATDTMYAGFPHLYFPANRGMAARFVEKADKYAALKNTGNGM